MSFPATGVAIPAATAGNNITLNDIRLSYKNNSHPGGAWSSGDAQDTTESQISLSNFHGATFTSGDTIDADGSPALSIGTHFCGKTFGSGGGGGGRR